MRNYSAIVLYLVICSTLDAEIHEANTEPVFFYGVTEFQHVIYQSTDWVGNSHLDTHPGQ